MEKQRQEYERQVQQLKIAMTPSTPHPPPFHQGPSAAVDPIQMRNTNVAQNSNVGNVNSNVVIGTANGSGLNVPPVMGSNSFNGSSLNGYTHKVIPSTPSVMSRLERWGQER